MAYMPSVKGVRIDMCRYGWSSVKPTRVSVAGRMFGSEALSLRCNHVGGHPSLRCRHGVQFLTAAAARYTEAFCQALAKTLADSHQFLRGQDGGPLHGERRGHLS